MDSDRHCGSGDIAGYSLNWYQEFWWFDKVLHAYTTFAVTLPLALLLYGAVLAGMRDHRFILVLTTIANLGVALRRALGDCRIRRR